MAKNGAKSWYPKRAGVSGKSATSSSGRDADRRDGGAVTQVKSASGSSSRHVSGKITLPNGRSITTVRKDVMDRALGRGDFSEG